MTSGKLPERRNTDGNRTEQNAGIPTGTELNRTAEYRRKQDRTAGIPAETGHEEAEKDFIRVFGTYLRLTNVLLPRNVSLTACVITSTGSMTYTSLNKDQHGTI